MLLVVVSCLRFVVNGLLLLLGGVCALFAIRGSSLSAVVCTLLFVVCCSLVVVG